MESFGRSDAADPADVVRRKGRGNSWIAQEWRCRAVCSLGMLPWSSRSVCLETQPWLKEILQALCESRVGEVKSGYEDQLGYWA